MSKLNQTDKADQVLDDDIVEALGVSISSETHSAARVNRLHERVVSQLSDDSTELNFFETIRNNEGEWIEVMPQVMKKVLQVDRERDVESYLMRLESGAQVPAHLHESDELCYVIEGDLAFGDIHLNGGDWHFARKGSTHAEASTVAGALLFLQTGLGGEQYDPVTA